MKYLILIGLPFVLSCSSLDESRIDRAARLSGNFECKPISFEDPNKVEHPADADVSRIRCAKDEWRLENKQTVFTRSLFQSRNCEGLLGRIAFSSSVRPGQATIPLKNVDCHVIRMNPGWTAEGAGKCMLHQLVLNAPYPVDVLGKCSAYVPDFCKNATGVTLRAIEGKDEHEPYIAIVAESAGQKVACYR